MTRRTLLAAAALLAVVHARPLSAQAPYRVENLGPRGGGAWLFAILPRRSEPALAVQLRADLGELAPSLRIAPSITFWASEFRDAEIADLRRRVEALCERGGSPCPGVDLGEVELSDLSLDLDAQYLWTTSFGVEPYAGAGVALHLVNAGGDLIAETFVEDILDGITPGVTAHAGIELPLAPALRLHGEVRGALAGSASWLGAGVGAAWTPGRAR